ncbi:MAG: anti-phage defense ZorAB system ZorA [Deltaproteobacteria bacterium]|nr:anti-phage defense ZorAB system ZorA [Deltaproteobacteria bacterium]
MNDIGICAQRLAISYTEIPWLTPPCADLNFSIKAPLFLWAACLLLVIVTGVFTVRCLLQSVPIVRSLKKITKTIDSIGPKDQPLDGVGLEQLRQIMAGNRLVADAWGEFDETLLVLSEDTRDQIFNTRQADEFFTFKSIIGGHINLGFYAAIPGILTSVGLLCTFIAILLGLSHITPDPNDPQKIKGVEDLVYSLSGKFISSICALGLAVFFTFFEKWRASKLYRAMHQFVRTLNRKFARKAAEHILHLIQKDISEQSIAFRQFGADLSGHLKEGFSEGMGPHFQKIAEAVDELRKHKSESLTDSLSQVITEFKGALMGSTNAEFKTLESTLSQVGDSMRAMIEQSKETQDKMSSVLNSLDVAVSRQSSSGQEHLARLANTMEIVIDKLQSATAQSSGTLASTVTTVLDQLQSGFNAQSGEISRRNTELSTLMRAMLDQIQASLSQSSSSVSSTVSGVLEKSSAWTEKTTAQFNSVIEEQGRNAQAIADARNALNDALNIFKQAVSDGSGTLNTMGMASSAVKDGVAILNGAVSALNGTQDRVSDLASLVQRNAENLKLVVDRQSEIVGKYDHVVSQLDSSLSHILTQVTSSIENYSSLMKKSIETTLGQFDSHLGNATAKLGGTVQDLSESLEELVELSAKAKGGNV